MLKPARHTDTKDHKQWEYRGGTELKNTSVLHYQNIVDPNLGSYAILVEKTRVERERTLNNREMIKLLLKATAAKRATVSPRPDIKSTLLTWKVPDPKTDQKELHTLLNTLIEKENIRTKMLLKRSMKRGQKNTFEI
jgi:hypothetical protein